MHLFTIVFKVPGHHSSYCSADNNLNTTAVIDTGLMSELKYLVREHSKKENSLRRVIVSCDEKQAGWLSASS